MVKDNSQGVKGQRIEVEIDHINDISDSSKVDTDGNFSTNLKINCQLKAGDIAMIHEMSKARIALKVVISSAQFGFVMVVEKAPDLFSEPVIDPEADARAAKAERKAGKEKIEA